MNNHVFMQCLTSLSKNSQSLKIICWSLNCCEKCKKTKVCNTMSSWFSPALTCSAINAMSSSITRISVKFSWLMRMSTIVSKAWTILYIVIQDGKNRWAHIQTIQCCVAVHYQQNVCMQVYNPCYFKLKVHTLFWFASKIGIRSDW